MLNAYNEKLSRLRDEMARGGKAESMLKELYAQRDELAQRVAEYARQLSQEQEDVDRLNGGFRAIYYTVIGKRKEMLEKERADVLRASMKYDMAKGELERVLGEIDKLEWEKHGVEESRRDYCRILDEKISVMRACGIHAEEIAEKEEQKEALAGQIREVNEAMRAGGRVLAQIDRIGEKLDSAEGYAAWDLFGGGIIADIAKHSQLDEAQQGVQRLERLLGEFRTELADIAVQTEIHAQVYGCMRFADSAVRLHIHESQQSLSRTETQVRRMMDKLHGMERDMRRKQEQIDEEIRALAEQA